MNVLFWDIDQTLVYTGHAGFLAIEHTLTEMMGPDATLPRFDAGGRTDNFICREILRHAMQKEPTLADVHQFSRQYEETLLYYMQETKGKILPYVKELLAYFSGMPDYDQLLLTGNSRRGAELKLTHYGLASYFDFDYSGFAGDDFNRIDVARRAGALARSKWGAELEKIFIIGDTEHDIQCGKKIGAYTIAVATGSRSLETLQGYEPWRALPELIPADAFQQLLDEADAEAPPMHPAAGKGE